MTAVTIKPSHLGGSMYGDGDYVVEFVNVNGTIAPMKARVIGGNLNGATAEITFGQEERRPTCGLAAQAIAAVRRAVESR